MINIVELAKALIAEGHNVYAYSGRGMFGRECLGVRVGRDELSFDLGFRVGMIVARQNPDNKTSNIEVFEAREDSFGRDSIVYFPYLKFSREDELVARGKDKDDE